MQNDFFYVYSVHPTQGVLKRRLLGRFVVWNDHMYILEDHFGFLERNLGKEGWITGKMNRAIQSLIAAQYIDLVTKRQMQGGARPDLVRPIDEGEPVQDSGGFSFAPEERKSDETHFFDLHRSGSAKPDRLELRGDKMYLNGAELDDAETDRILVMLSNKAATVRIPMPTGPAAMIAKAEGLFEPLVKVDPHLSQALGHIRDAVKKGHVSPEALKSIQKELFVDSMVPGVGNRRAYNDFLARPKQGVHIRMDGNDFGAINKIHGFEVGDSAIHAMGKAIRDSMDEAVGSKNGKVYRIGGDEFHAFVPNHEHAAMFARAVQKKLAEIPSIGGTHALSLSIGLGHSPGHAEGALIQAKEGKKAAGYKPGRAKTHVHSLLTGMEGPLRSESDPQPGIPAPIQVGAPQTGRGGEDSSLPHLQVPDHPAGSQ